MRERNLTTYHSIERPTHAVNTQTRTESRVYNFNNSTGLYDNESRPHKLMDSFVLKSSREETEQRRVEHPEPAKERNLIVAEKVEEEDQLRSLRVLRRT